MLEILPMLGYAVFIIVVVVMACAVFMRPAPNRKLPATPPRTDSGSFDRRVDEWMEFLKATQSK
jgi:hypothetical protein